MPWKFSQHFTYTYDDCTTEAHFNLYLLNEKVLSRLSFQSVVKLPCSFLEQWWIFESQVVNYSLREIQIENLAQIKSNI